MQPVKAPTPEQADMFKINKDASPGEKLLRLFQKLMLDGRRHFQTDLARYLECSPQSVMRLVAEIERVVGASLETGLDRHRRWYQIKTISRNRLGLDLEELRYLAVCRDMAEPLLPDPVKQRVDQSIFNFSMLLADQEYAHREDAQKKQFVHSFKGWIDYTPYFEILEKLIEARDKKVICIVHYQALAADKPKEHRFAVSRLIAMQNALYALGALTNENPETIKHYASLAVHRVKGIALTGRKIDFTMPEGDLATFGLPWHEPRRFRIHFKSGKAASYVTERVWSNMQTFLPQPDGSLIMEMVSRSEPEVTAWVRSFGEAAELLSVEDMAQEGEGPLEHQDIS